MKPVNRRYLRIMAIAWGIALVVFAVFYLLVLIPQTKQRGRIEADYNKAKSEADAAAFASNISQQQKLNQQVETMDARAGDFVFTTADAGNLVFDISKISSEIGLKTFGVSSSGNERISLYDNCRHIFAKRIQVSFNAGFNNFAAFINVLEKHRPVIFVNTFSITRVQQGEAANKVDMELAVLVGKDNTAGKVR